MYYSSSELKCALQCQSDNSGLKINYDILLLNLISIEFVYIFI